MNKTPAPATPRGLFVLLILLATGLAVWRGTSRPPVDRQPAALAGASPAEAAPPGAPAPSGPASPGGPSAGPAGVTGTRVSRAAAAAAALAARSTGIAEFDRFNAWSARYLAATGTAREALVAEGLALAAERRPVLARLIPADPRRALDNAVPPVIRQELPAAVAAQLEERVNEQAFFGVLGLAPTAESADSPAYRREVRTDDGGAYQAYTYGRRSSQPTTLRASIVGIAVDDILAVDERPLRAMAAGEIPNHPNNLTRRRRVVPLDERGFTQEPEVRETQAPAHPLVTSCPVSGQTTEVPGVTPEAEPVVAPEVAEGQAVVEAAGQVHYLCRGGHITGFEDELVAQEGGNGGPVKPTNPPPATQGTGYKSHLLMRVAFPEALRGSITEIEGQTLGKNVQDWFTDSSFGAMSFLTTVTPLIVLPRTEAWYKIKDTSGSAYEVLTDARAAAKLAGFDPANFDFDTVIYTGTPGSFGGQAYVGGKGCWLKSGTGTGVAAHEYGHNFGLWHSNFHNTSNGSPIGGGSHVEYGDSFDTMGSASAGDLHFNAYQKNLLNWIGNPVVHQVGASGTYRIYPMDQPTQDPLLRYGIRLRKDSDRDYWVSLRQRFTGNAWVQGGVFLHWSPWVASSSGPHLLDMTPGSPDAKTDAPLVVGRTFSDWESGIHITTWSKNATTPASMDVVVNLGTFPGNQAPVLDVAASATSVATGTAVTFTATASDPDGDTLSYAWDFGDKSFSTVNSATVTKTWTTAGEYRVRCTASDMKGQTTSRSVIVTVGSPTTFRISGTVTFGGQPLADVRVHNGLTGSSYRGAFTDADGTYTIVGLTAGTYTVGTQLYGYTLTPVGSASVTVGPSATGVDFTAATSETVSIAVLDADCTEGANTGTFRISRTGSAALTVNCFSPTGTASKGSDYTLTPDVVVSGSYSTFTIPAGQPFLDVVVTALDDTAVESFESVTLEVVPSTAYVLGNAVATLQIGDADTSNSLVRLRVEDRDAFESGDPGRFIIERLGSTAGSLTVNVALSGTAANGTDYTSIPGTVTIPAGASTVAVNVAPIQDAGIEAVETVTLTINSNAAYTRAPSSADNSGTINLYDDDLPTVTVAATDAAAAEAAADPGVFTVTRTGDITGSLTVNYGLTGSALHGTDYLALPGVLTIPAGSATATVTITPIDDSIGEPAQTAVLQLRSGTGYAVGSASSATVTITDNGDLPYVSLDVVSAQAVESGTTGSFRITTAGTGTGNITVRYTVSGTASNGVDYNLLSGSASVGRNTTSTLTITPIQDTLAEGYETITLTLNPDPAYNLGLDSSATMNLQDDELPQVNVSATNDSFSESNGSLAKFFISRTGATTASLTVNYLLGGTATAGVDYTPPAGSLTIPAGAAGAYVDISMLADTLAEGTETIILSVAPDPAYLAGIGSATRFITDAQQSSVSTQAGFSAASSSVNEGAGTTSIPVVLNAASANPVSVDFYLNGGTALGGGVDYRLPAGTLTFAPGETSKSIVVQLMDDTAIEGNETLVITLGNPVNARLGTSSHTVTIINNDTQPTPTYTVATSSSPAAGGSTAGGGTYNSGATATVTATPASGYVFVNWTEGATVLSTSASYTFTVNANRTLVANFNPVTYTIATTVTPAGAGTASGGGSYANGTSVTVTASPNAGYAFLNWTEGATVVSTSASYTFTASANRTLVANFTPTYVVATSASPAAGGSTAGGGTFNSGATATVTATAASGYVFVNWTEGATVVSTSASYAFTVTANRTLVANFNPATYSIATSASPAEGGTTAGGGSYAHGTSVTLTAVANAGFAFVNWTEGATVVSTSDSYTFTAAADRTLVANFVPTHLVATSASPAEGGTTSGDGTFNNGSSVTVTATANTGYAFVNWTEDGSEVSSLATYTFTLSADRTLVANFIPTYVVTTGSSPAAGGSTSGGGTYNSGSSVTVTATPASGYVFANWTEDGSVVSSSAAYTFTAGANRTLVANFSLATYTIGTSVTPAGSGSTTGGGTYTHGDSVTVTATANAGFAFVNWTDGATVLSTSATYTFTASADRTLVANFTPTYSVTTSSSPTEGGTTAGGGTYNSGTSVTVTATPAAGYTFANWTEGATVVSTSASYTFTVGANRTLVANFTPRYTVATSSSPAAGGTTSGGGTYNSGTSVTVTATPASGYVFANWTEGATVVSASASYTFTVSANRTLVANFNLVSYTITTQVSPATMGSVTGGGTYTSGSSVTLQATPSSGNRFIGWTEGPTVVGTSSSLTFTASASRTLVANFGPQLPTGWAGQLDIGTPGTAGNNSSNNIAPNSFLIVAGAGNISGKADNFRYLYQNLTGDGSITVQVPSFQDTGTSARVGVMIRDALTPGSVTAFLGVNGSGGIQWVRRTRASGNATSTTSATVTAPNVWLRITRTGSTFTAARSTDGNTWTTIGSDTINMVANPFIGIAVASGTSALNTATFSNVTVVP